MQEEKLITYNGETLNERQWAEKIGIPKSTFRSRLRSGMSMDEIITRPIKKQKKHCYKGKHVSIADIARMNGTISETTAARWISEGMSIEEVIKTPRKRVPAKGKDGKPIGCTHPDCDSCPFPDECHWR